MNTTTFSGHKINTMKISSFVHKAKETLDFLSPIGDLILRCWVSYVKGALAKQNLELRTGDAVLIHTGWGGLYGKDNAHFIDGDPGVGIEAVRWLYDQHIAITGADTWSYGPVPGEDASRPFLVPQTMYVQMGLFGLENLATEELANRKVYEFLFVLTHGKTRGSTAAVVAPAAVY